LENTLTALYARGGFMVIGKKSNSLLVVGGGVFAAVALLFAVDYFFFDTNLFGWRPLTPCEQKLATCQKDLKTTVVAKKVVEKKLAKCEKNCGVKKVVTPAPAPPKKDSPAVVVMTRPPSEQDTHIQIVYDCHDSSECGQRAKQFRANLNLNLGAGVYWYHGLPETNINQSQVNAQQQGQAQGQVANGGAGGQGGQGGAGGTGGNGGNGGGGTNPNPPPPTGGGVNPSPPPTGGGGGGTNPNPSTGPVSP